MAADVACRRKRDLYSLYLDDPHPLQTPSSDLNPSPLYKRIRFSSSPPVQGSAVQTGDILRLEVLFPDLEPQECEGVLEACGNHLDSAIKRLTDIQCKNKLAENLPADGSGWVEILVSEMTSASSMEDAKGRASRVLELLEKSIVDHAMAEAPDNHEEENKVLKEHVAKLLHDNAILKRAVVIQHEHQKDFNEKCVELQQLKLIVSQYQERIRTLEVNNYALLMHLRQAQQSSPITGRSYPDVF